MSTPSAQLFVLVGEHFACIQIKGRANFTSSIDFRTLVNELLQRGYQYFVLDLSECALMDSTFLGVLAGFGLKMNADRTEQQDRAIELLNPNARMTELLENLGVLHLFRVRQGDAFAEASEPEVQPTSRPSKAELTQACLEAHETLMHIHPENVSRFKEVARFLAEDLKRLKAEEPKS